jgi:predicted negative regulator of RcsB-dependent stress response
MRELKYYMPEKAKAIINESTLLPISAVLVLMAGVFWLAAAQARSDARQDAQAQAIIQLTQKQEEYNRTTSLIDQRLARIEGKLGVGDK